MKYFCLPSDFKNETIDSYFEINMTHEQSKVIEVYGQMAPDSYFGSLRVNSQLPVVDKKSLEKYIKYCLEKKIEFNYIINATTMGNDELTNEGYKKIKKLLELLVDIGVTSVTIALPSIMEIAKFVSPGLKIKASTVCQINSASKAKFYDKLGIKRIVLDEDIYRRFDLLKNIRKAYSGELEVIVNSYCSNDCPYKMFHYNALSFSNLEKELYPYYSDRCKNEHLDENGYIKLNWIRPEDLHYYNDIGINYFKIQGRTNVFYGDPVKALLYYINGRYDGDLVSLLELFSSKRSLAIADVVIENRKLDGFLTKFVFSPESCKKLCDDCNYCTGYTEAGIKPSDRMTLSILKTMNKIVLEDFPEKLDS